MKMKCLDVAVTLHFHIHAPSEQEQGEAAKRWIQEVDRVVFKDEINYGAYDLEVVEDTTCTCHEESE